DPAAAPAAARLPVGTADGARGVGGRVLRGIRLVGGLAVGDALPGEAVLDVLRLPGVDRVEGLRRVAGLAAARVGAGVVRVGIAHAPSLAGRASRRKGLAPGGS